MSTLVEKIKEHPQIFHSSRGKMVRVWEAEDQLGLTFPEEYEAYLCHFGAIGFGSVEWTGINVDPELNVVRVTRRAREEAESFPAGCFVLRVSDAEGRMVVCSETEPILALQEGSGPEQICEGLVSYFERCLEEGLGETLI